MMDDFNTKFVETSIEEVSLHFIITDYTESVY